MDATTRKESVPVYSPQHRAMEIFAGQWTITGKNGEGAGSAAGSAVNATGDYRIMPGGFFLEIRETADFDGNAHITLMVMGYDPNSETYPVHFFNNTGYTRTYTGSLRKNSWTLTGKLERASYTFGEDGNSYTAYWERTQDGINWLPLCELTATKSA